jgi:hypothetical protein
LPEKPPAAQMHIKAGIVMLFSLALHRLNIYLYQMDFSKGKKHL